MSAIAKPLAIFTNALAPYNKTTVPVECVQSMEKLDVGPTPNQPANTAEYSIIFEVLLPGNTQTKKVVIKFATSAARNTSFTNFQTTYTASVA